MTGIKNLNFSSRGTNYTANASDIFMDNGARIVFIPMGKYANPTAERIPISVGEWNRIKDRLSAVDYEEYFGKKPSVNGVTIYQVKQ